MNRKEDLLQKILAKFEKTASRVRDGIPSRTQNGVFDDMENQISYWTNGFWGGLLWLAYAQTRNPEFLQWANGAEDKLDRALGDFEKLDHDVGFMWHLTAVANYKATGNEKSAKRGFVAASALASRFTPGGAFIRAWNGVEVNGWAIIDCMMNLPLLYWAADYRKDPHFSNIAQAHAETTMRNFIYPDGSSKHICVFDPVSGEYQKNLMGQGYDETSAWSRGNAWALYGFTLSAKYTGRQDFLDTACRVADFFLSHLPDDFVPYADFKAPPEINVYRDTSAAACAASGLVLLASLADPSRRETYLDAAEKIVWSLYERYTDWENDEALLQQGCIAFHSQDASVLKTSLIYGDYFFLEAVLRLCGKDGLF